jgi:hypothetical protein
MGVCTSSAQQAVLAHSSGPPGRKWLAFEENVTGQLVVHTPGRKHAVAWAGAPSSSGGRVHFAATVKSSVGCWHSGCGIMIGVASQAGVGGPGAAWMLSLKDEDEGISLFYHLPNACRVVDWTWQELEPPLPPFDELMAAGGRIEVQASAALETLRFDLKEKNGCVKWWTQIRLPLEGTVAACVGLLQAGDCVEVESIPFELKAVAQGAAAVVDIARSRVVR